MALKDQSTNEKLNSVLEYLNNEYSKTFIKVSKDEPMPTFAISFEKQYLKSKLEILTDISFSKGVNWIDEMDLILEYLCDVEHYIAKDQSNNETKYRILYAGKVFIESGGYVERERLLKKKQHDDDLLDLKTLENANRLNDLTKWLAVATSLLFLLEFLKFVLAYHLW